MVTHWETSKRPLFVKTIWKNGQHHVVLYKNETTTTTNMITSRRQSSRRRSYSSIVSQNCLNKISIRNDNKLQISTVKLLLTNCANNNNNTNNNNHNKIDKNNTNIYRCDKNPVTINITPCQSIKYKNFTNDIMFEQIKTLSVEYKHSTDKTRAFWYPLQSSTINYRTTQNCLNTNLTERVMVWLDLATENLKDNDKIVRKQQRTTTANYRSNVKNKFNTLNNNNNKQTKHKPNYRFDEHSDADQSIIEEFLVNEDRDGDDHDALTQIDCDEFRKNDDLIKSKRQLHIFLPNISKQLNEYGSSLSSKSSSLLQQNK